MPVVLVSVTPPIELLQDNTAEAMFCVQVSLCHMGCRVGKGIGGVEEVTFLYRLTPGACPKSYGVNVARLAGWLSFLLLLPYNTIDYELGFLPYGSPARRFCGVF